MGSRSATISARLAEPTAAGLGPAASDIVLLRQAVDLLEDVGDSLYTCTPSICPGASVGKHLRHCLDFYACFLDGLPAGEIDYARRNRDRGVETRRESAIARLHETIRGLSRIRASDLRRPLRIHGEETGRDEEGRAWSHSTVLRELQFLRSHSIHHYALIAIIMRALGLDPDRTFGVAPSTLRHWRKVGACTR